MFQKQKLWTAHEPPDPPTRVFGAESISIVDVSPRLVYNYPQPVHGEVDAFSGFGVANAALFLLIYWKISRERKGAGGSEKIRVHQALKTALWRFLEIFDLALGWLLVGIAALLLVPMFLAGSRALAGWLAEKLEDVIMGKDKRKRGA